MFGDVEMQRLAARHEEKSNKKESFPRRAINQGVQQIIKIKEKVNSFKKPMNSEMTEEGYVAKGFAAVIAKTTLEIKNKIKGEDTPPISA